jgi:RNA polymerase sigma factor (sigma-70 family)
MGCVTWSSDEEIVRGLHAGDPSTLDQLVGAYRRPLVRYADGILAGDGSAEDVVQETFLRVWTRRQDLKPTGSMRAFLYTLTRNAAIDERRRSARRAHNAFGCADPAGPPSPLEHAAASELATTIANAVSRLPPRRRKIFMLVRVDGLTYREVADGLGLAPQTVANQMSAAMATLRDALGQHCAASSWRTRSQPPVTHARRIPSRAAAVPPRLDRASA